MNKLETIREKCIEANPSIKDLVFGCEIENVIFYKDAKKKEPDWMRRNELRGTVIKDLRSDFLPMWVDYGDQLEFEISPHDYVSFDIIGRPIRLADVLLAIRKVKGSAYDFAELLGLDWDSDGIIEEYRDSIWNLLKDDLTQQSDETIDFLYELLK